MGNVAMDSSLDIFGENILKEACHYRVYDEYGEFIVGRESLYDAVLTTLRYSKEIHNIAKPRVVIVALKRSQEVKPTNFNFVQISVAYVAIGLVASDKWEPTEELKQCNWVI